jgi:hypothetical protein
MIEKCLAGDSQATVSKICQSTLHRKCHILCKTQKIAESIEKGTPLSMGECHPMATERFWIIAILGAECKPRLWIYHHLEISNLVNANRVSTRIPRRPTEIGILPLIPKWRNRVSKGS